MVKKITKKGVEEFVSKELAKAVNDRMHCMDERYTKEQSEGAVRVPGGDFGMVMAFAGALKDEGTQLTPEEIIERYFKTVKRKRGDNAKLYYHDDDSDHEIGCGHAAMAMSQKYDGLYGSLTYTEIRQLYVVFTNHPNTSLTTLKGEHGSDGVLFIHGESAVSPIPYSVHSQDEERKEKFFVVDIDRAYRFIDKATPHFSVGLQKFVNAEDVKRNFLLQLKTTAGVLAAGLSKYDIVINPQGNFQMEQLPN